MIGVHLKMVGVVVGTLFFFTLVSNIIPQVESDVPRQVAFTADMPAEEIVAIGSEIYRGVGGCAACHRPDTDERAPVLHHAWREQGPIGERCGARVPGLSCRDYLWQALVDPNADMVEGYPPIMPSASRTLSDQQILSLVAYLESLGGEVTVTGEELVAAGDAAAAAPAAAGPAAGAVQLAATEPREILGELCMICHTLGGEGNAMGPTFDDMGARRSADWIRRKILEPGFELSEGYEAFAGVMPGTFGDQLTAAQLEAIVAYLAELR